MATCPMCGGLQTRLVRDPCGFCGGNGQATGGGNCGACRGSGRQETRETCPMCVGPGTVSDTLKSTHKTPAKPAPGPRGDKLWESAGFLVGWMARLPRWIVWPICVACGVICALWMARQPDVLNGVVVLAGFAGLFVPALAYIAVRYVVGLSIKLTVGALQLAAVLFVGYVALVAFGVVQP